MLDNRAERRSNPTKVRRGTSTGGVLPNFLLIGAMKAGTDSLYRYLGSHPDIFMSRIKELDFFAAELNWGLGAVWYRSHFDGGQRAPAVGEASTSYSKFPDYGGVPARIAAHLPDVRIIYLVRHPIERMRSHYLHWRLIGREDRSFERALLERPQYLDWSRYGMQLAQYLDYFPPGSLLVIPSESLRAARRGTLERVFTFLGVDPTWSSPELDTEFHRTAEKRALRPIFNRLRTLPGYGLMGRVVPPRVKEATLRLRTSGVDPREALVTAGLRDQLEDRLREDIRRLRNFLGDSFDGWGIA